MGMNVVTFDGEGGSNTISHIVILKDMISRINWDRERSGQEPLELADLVQVMGGTGLGGVVAVLLGGLRMSPDEAMEELARLIHEVFNVHDLSADARSQKLEVYFAQVLKRYNLHPTITLRQLSHIKHTPLLILGCGVASNSTAFRPLSTHPLRNFNQECDITVVQAIRATCATQHFRPVSVGPENFQEELVSCTGLYANPSKEIYYLILKAFGEGISCLISLGNGIPSIIKGWTSPATLLYLEVNRTVDDMHRELGPTSRFFRFSVDRESTPDNATLAGFGEIISHTKSYLSSSVVEGRLEICCLAMRGQLEVPKITFERCSGSIQGNDTSFHTGDEYNGNTAVEGALAWARNMTTPSRILLLSNLPGCFETSFAEGLSVQLKNDGRLAFVYSFSTKNGKTPQAVDLCHAVFFDLCSFFVSLRPLLRSMRPHIPLILRHNLRTQWETLVVDTLKRLHRPSTIVIDALEECSSSERTEVLSLLLDTFCGPNAVLPKFKVVVVCRRVKSDMLDILSRSEYVRMIRPLYTEEQGRINNPEVESSLKNRPLHLSEFGRTESPLLEKQSQIIDSCKFAQDQAPVQVYTVSHPLGALIQHPSLLKASPKPCYDVAQESAPITTVAVSTASGFMLTGHRDWIIRLWMAHVSEPISFKAHTGSVLIVCFSPCGTRFASGSTDNSVRLWDIGVQAVCEAMTGHRDAVVSLDWSPCGGYIVSGSRDHTLRIWNTSTREPAGKAMSNSLGPITQVKFTTDGLYIASSSSTGVLAIWSARNRKLLARENVSTGIVQVAWSSQNIFARLQSGIVQVWAFDSTRNKLSLVSSLAHDAVLLPSQRSPHLLISSPVVFGPCPVCEQHPTPSQGHK